MLFELAVQGLRFPGADASASTAGSAWKLAGTPAQVASSQPLSVISATWECSPVSVLLGVTVDSPSRMGTNDRSTLEEARMASNRKRREIFQLHDASSQTKPPSVY